MPHYKLDTGPVRVEPQPPKTWPTGFRYWVRKEGPFWGVYWAVQSRWINAVAHEAYLQRHDEWMKEMAETLWEETSQ
jgi:hypothetical protein